MTTTAQAFASFEADIRLTTAEDEKAKKRQGLAAALMSEAFPNSVKAPYKAWHRMGSIHRGVAIRPLADIDIFVQFRNKDNVFEEWRSDSQKFLYYVRDRIDAKTQVQQVGSRGQAVRLFYKDGLWVDIAPSFKWSSSGYALPAGDGKWLTVDPLKQNEWAARRHADLDHNLNPTVRLLKKWNAAHSRRLGSWHLHVMTGTLFGRMGSNRRQCLKFFFGHAADYLDVSDPDGHQGLLSTGLSGATRVAIMDSFAAAHTRCTKAIDAEADGRHTEAKRLWKVVLGDAFPA